MKKKVVLFMLALSVVGLLSGCSNSNTEETTAITESTADSESTDESAVATEAETSYADAHGKETFQEFVTLLNSESALDHVTLGEYKGLEVEITTDYTVTDEHVAAEMESITSALVSEVTDRAVQEGDTVNIDFVGKKDDVAFDGGSSTGYILVIGSGSFIDGFEDGLIGVEIGQTVDLDLTFPDPYQNNTELSGAEVVFTVTVNSISEPSELTDEWVAANTDYATVAEYEAQIRAELEETAAAKEASEKVKALWVIINESFTAKSFPKGAVELMVNYYTAVQEAEAEAASLSLEEYLETYYTITLDEFNENMQLSVEEMVAQELFMLAIAETEGIELSDEEFAEMVVEYAANYYTTEDEFIEAYGELYLRHIFLWDKVDEFLGENTIGIYTPEAETETMIVTEAETTEETTAETGEETETESQATE